MKPERHANSCPLEYFYAETRRGTPSQSEILRKLGSSVLRSVVGISHSKLRRVADTIKNRFLDDTGGDKSPDIDYDYTYVPEHGVRNVADNNVFGTQITVFRVDTPVPGRGKSLDAMIERIPPKIRDDATAGPVVRPGK